VGIGSDVIELLIKLRISGLLHRRTAVMEIGAQQLANSFLSEPDRIVWLGHVLGIDRPLSLPPPRPSHIVHGELEHLEAAAPPARDFWRWLGFEYAAIDIDGSAGSVPLDLNFDSAPPEEIGRYNLVTNFGTTEHVVNQLNAFKVIHDLTAVGGIMMHRVPVQGMFNHGLVNYNPKFFWMLARSNGYRFVHADYDHSREFYSLPNNIVEFLNSQDPTAVERTRDCKAADACMSVALEKVVSFPFVPPIDVPTGTRTDIESLKMRYWTVFDPERFERLCASAPP
jgi:hypothetical protein